jgi:cytoskeletal protein CcmA (bactofilin family)
MFGKAKKSRADKNRDPAPVQQMQRLALVYSAAPDPPESISCISSGVTIIGRIVGDGTIKISGRIEGELKASTIVVTDGAEVVGDIVADDLTIGGRVKGTIHANRVKLDGTAVVEGDIFHGSLSIEDNARFEGSSRRKNDVLDKPSRGPMHELRAEPETHVMAIDGNHRLNGQPNNEAQAHQASA